ncbi:hypothetical protein ACL02T_23320 [Pseudonocardia sp. RS010]|uniref:hypothetical protein n=1 Tax=Pseudonocardia sp. RS010 TaxID=3385979 RepID=UPI00399FD691
MSFVLLCDRCGTVCIWDVPPPDKHPLCDPCAGRPPRIARRRPHRPDPFNLRRRPHTAA